MRLTLGEIVEGQRAEVPCGSPDTSFEGASVDSRAVPPDALFVGLPGENHDGGRFAADALRAGAAAALVGRDVWPSIEGECRANGWSVAVAHDPLVVLQAAGRHVLGHLGATVVAITGSVGKTTTKDILECVDQLCRKRLVIMLTVAIGGLEHERIAGGQRIRVAVERDAVPAEVPAEDDRVAVFL